MEATHESRPEHEPSQPEQRPDAGMPNLYGDEVEPILPSFLRTPANQSGEQNTDASSQPAHHPDNGMPRLHGGEVEPILPLFLRSHASHSIEHEAQQRTDATQGPAPRLPSLLPSSGGNLPTPVHRYFTTRLNTDLSGVRVHTDPAADDTARRLNTRAFAFGTDIGFKDGEYAPHTPAGRELLAHELAHVAQYQRGQLGSEVALWGGDDDTEELPFHMLVQQRLENQLPQTLYSLALDETGTIDVTAALLEASDEALSDLEILDEDQSVIDTRLSDIGSLTVQYNDQPYNMAELFRAYRETVLPGSYNDSTVNTYGLMLMTRLIAEQIARFVAAGLNLELQVPASDTSTETLADTHSEFRRGRVLEHMQALVDALNDSQRLLHLELEGVVAALIDRRLDFELALADDDGTAQAIGQEIQMLSRQALMLNRTLQEHIGQQGNRLDPEQEPDAGSPLQAEIVEAGAQIEDIQVMSRDARGTLDFLGARLENLGRQGVTLYNDAMVQTMASEDYQTSDDQMNIMFGILPEQAFPEQTDTAVNAAMAQVTDRLTSQMQTLSTLREEVIPASPTYNLEEFTQIFRRWTAFYSREEEQQDPIFQLGMDLFGGIHRATAMDVGGPGLDLQMGLARGFMMHQAVEIMQRGAGGGYTTQFADSLPRAHRYNEVTGFADSTHYSFAETYDRGARSLSRTGEEQSRRRVQRRGETRSRRAVRAVTEQQPAQRPARSVTEGLARIALPLRGFPAPPQETSSPNVLTLPGLPFPTGGSSSSGPLPRQAYTTVPEEGWAYLTDVHAPPPDMYNRTVARELRVVPTEVTSYLLALEQHRASLADPHYLTTRTGESEQHLGGAAERTGGLEEGFGNYAALYERGESDTRRSDEADTLRRTARSARGSLSDANITPESDTSAMIAGLMRSFEDYFSEFFSAHEEDTYHIAAVLAIASVDFSVGQAMTQILDPARLAEVMAQAIAMSAGLTALNMLGPLGRLVGAAVEGYMATQGVSEITAAVTLVSFFRGAAEADSLHTARIWALIASTVMEDIQALVDSAISTPVTQVMTHIATNPPRTDAEMADMVRPMMRDPELRAQLEAGVEMRMRELEGEGALVLREHPEYDALARFQRQLLDPHADAIQSALHPEPPPRALPEITPETRRAIEEFYHPPQRLRGAEVHEVREALGPHADSVDVVRSEREGNGVEVHYQGDRLRMVMEQGATAVEVGRHLETVAQLRRYQGVRGRIRRLLTNVRNRLLGLGEVGSRDFEARREVEKLDRIITEMEADLQRVEARAERLSSDPELAANRDEQDAIAREIDDLQRQLVEHALEFGNPEPGLGYIAAADARSAGQREASRRQLGDPPDGHYWRFQNGRLQLVNYRWVPEGMYYEPPSEAHPNGRVRPASERPRSRREDSTIESETFEMAFNELGGNDGSTPFGKFVRGLDDVMIAQNASEDAAGALIRSMREGSRADSPAGMRWRSLRSPAKRQVIEQYIVPYLTDPASLRRSEIYQSTREATGWPREALAAASHTRLMELTRGMDSADRGALGEMWYNHFYGRSRIEGEAESTSEWSPVSTQQTQVGVSQREMAMRGRDIGLDRSLDSLQGDRLVELKNVSGRFGNRELGEFDAQLSILGTRIDPGDGQFRDVNRLTWISLDPLGTQANAAWMHEQLGLHPELEFHIFNSWGQMETITQRNRDRLTEPGLSQWLGVDEP